MKRAIIGAGALLALWAILVPSQAMADKAPAEITIDVLDEGGIYSWNGEITSPKPTCKKDRKITVYRRNPGKDEKIGSVNSFPSLDPGDHTWYWLVEDPGKPNGEYYAKAKATDRCKKAKSPVIGVSPR